MTLEFGSFDHMEREPGVPLCLTPSQNVFLAAAQRTSRISVLPDATSELVPGR